MKRYICFFLLFMMTATAFAVPAENTAAPLENSPAPTAELTPTPSPVPAGKPFSCELFSLTLPYGYTAMDASALAGYDAAANSDYPGAGETMMAASNEAADAFLYIAVSESALDGPAAAKEAAQAILANADYAMEISFGTQLFGRFACMIDGVTFDLYFTSNGSKLLTAAACGVHDSDMAAMLESLVF